MKDLTTPAVGCIVAATAIIGDKWSPQLIRHIANIGTVGFCQLQDLVGSINPSTLSSRLSHLETKGVVEKTLREDSTRHEYRLTQKGAALVPILRDMERWSAQYADASTT